MSSPSADIDKVFAGATPQLHDPVIDSA